MCAYAMRINTSSQGNEICINSSVSACAHYFQLLMISCECVSGAIARNFSWIFREMSLFIIDLLATTLQLGKDYIILSWQVNYSNEKPWITVKCITRRKINFAVIIYILRKLKTIIEKAGVCKDTLQMRASNKWRRPLTSINVKPKSK